MEKPFSRSASAAGGGGSGAQSAGGTRSAVPRRSLWGDAWREFRRRRLALAGLAALGLIVFGVLIGPLVYATPPDRIDFAASLQPPSAAHHFGTNDLGQDTLARVLSGGRISLAVGAAAMLVTITLGTLVGAVAGYAGGLLDGMLMRLTDVFLALPQLPLLMLIIFLFREPMADLAGPETGVFLLIVLIIGGLNWMALARIVRASVLSLRAADFVLAAEALGVPRRQILIRHILPNALGPIIVAATLAVGAAILAESSLSFLGLGFPPDTPTWGRMLFEAQNAIEFAPWLALFPGCAIFLSVLSINYIGDALRDALDPQLRGR
jgi:peptide/nickel transport system permease protein